MIQFLIKKIQSTFLNHKHNFIKSQKKWQELRTLNSDYERLGCDGGTGCSDIVSSAEIKRNFKKNARNKGSIQLNRAFTLIS
jgi:hypothetical protein